MRLGMLAAWGLVCFVGLPAASGCTRALDFDALDGDRVDSDGGVDVPATAQPVGGLDAGVPCRLITPAPAFCDDFDTRPLGDAWNAILAAPADGGTLAQDARESLSPPNSLLVAVKQGIAAKTYVGMGLHQVLPRPSKAHWAIEVSFDLKVEEFDRTSVRDVVAFQLLVGETAAGSQRNQLVLDLQSTGSNGVSARLNDGVLDSKGALVTGLQSELRAQPTPDRWTHVTFTLDVRAPDGKNQVTVRIGPSDAFATQAVLLYDGPLQHELQPGQPLIEVGIPWLDTDKMATSDWRIRYDNVLVHIREE